MKYIYIVGLLLNTMHCIGQEQNIGNDIVDDFALDLMEHQDIPKNVRTLLYEKARDIYDIKSTIFDNCLLSVDEICRHLIFEEKEKKEKEIDGFEIGKIIFKGALSTALGFVDKWGGPITSLVTTPWEVYDDLNKTKKENAEIRIENAKIRSRNEMLSLWDDVKNEIISKDSKLAQKEIFEKLITQFRDVKQNAINDKVDGPIEDFLKDVYNLKLSIPPQYQIKHEMLEIIYSELGISNKAGIVINLDFTDCGPIENIDLKSEICMPPYDNLNYSVGGPNSTYFMEQFQSYFTKTGTTYDNLSVYKYYKLKFTSEKESRFSNMVKDDWFVMIGSQFPDEQTNIMLLDYYNPISLTVNYMLSTPLFIRKDGKNIHGYTYGEIFASILDNYSTRLQSIRLNDVNKTIK